MNKVQPKFQKIQKPYDQMTASELAAATKEFNQEFIGTPGKSLTTTQKRQHQRAARAGRPRVGRGSARINITMERTLLRRTDQAAHKQGLSRAAMGARALRHELAAAARL